MTSECGEATEQKLDYITVLAQELPGIYVSEVTYHLGGGNPKHLRVRMHVGDESDQPAPGAFVAFDLYREGSLYASSSGTTNQDGYLQVQYNRAPLGCYTTVVTALDLEGYFWDGQTPANEYCKTQ